MEKDQLKSLANDSESGIKITNPSHDCIKIQQVHLVNGYMLTNKELFIMAKQLYSDKKIIPVTYSLDINDIKLDWITQKMEEYGIYRKDIVRQLAIDKQTLSDIFKGKVALSPITKAAFYYYFLTFEINRNLRKKFNVKG